MNLDGLQLATPRLLLRLPHAGELDAWAEMMADSEAARFIGGVMARSLTWRALMTMIGTWHDNGFAMFSVYEKATGRWVGWLGPCRANAGGDQQGDKGHRGDDPGVRRHARQR